MVEALRFINKRNLLISFYPGYVLYTRFISNGIFCTSSDQDVIIVMSTSIIPFFDFDYLYAYLSRRNDYFDFFFRYFVMTKKSSFLRQLNLYSFNRFSGTSPNKGSYYHEKFLRGKKFLTRRMTRQKVNGNRIRSAGNPEKEPDLSSYSVCNGNRIRSEKL